MAYGNPDNRKKKQIEEIGAATGVARKNENETKKQCDAEGCEIRKEPAAVGEQLGDRRLPDVSADSEKAAQLRQSKFQEKSGDTGERDGITNPPIAGSMDVVVTGHVASYGENGGAEESRDEGGSQGIEQKIHDIAHGVEEQVGMQALFHEARS